MTATPDSFSMSDLKALLDNAPIEDEVHTPQIDPENPTEDQIDQVVSQGLDLMTDQIKDPVVHKVALLRVASNMALWHTKIAEGHFERGCPEGGTAWMRDAGKWQAIMDIAMSITLGDNDAWLTADHAR